MYGKPPSSYISSGSNCLSVQLGDQPFRLGLSAMTITPFSGSRPPAFFCFNFGFASPSTCFTSSSSVSSSFVVSSPSSSLCSSMSVSSRSSPFSLLPSVSPSCTRCSEEKLEKQPVGHGQINLTFLYFWGTLRG